MPQLEGPTTKNIQLCTGGLWGEKEKENKILKKKNIQLVFSLLFLSYCKTAIFYLDSEM